MTEKKTLKNGQFLSMQYERIQYVDCVYLVFARC